MIFHSIVFSLGDPQKNEYVYLLALLVQSLKRVGTYKPQEDIYYVMADAATIPVLREIPVLSNLQYLEIPKPVDVYQGMTYKYRLFDYAETSNEVVMYLDVDLLNIKPSRLAIAPDRLYVFPEGSKWDDNYRGSDKYFLDLSCGFSAGFFLYRWGERVEATFDEILRRMDRTEERWYTLDQPHFNHSLLYRPGCVNFLPETFLSFNGHNNQRTAHFLNLAGDPGNGPFHFRKALGMYLALF
jgi:hypothetical protein